ncbi:MAG: lysylphosphatidylglycerol synthase transmembrane domain-containing protein [Spirochaetota bacterium]
MEKKELRICRILRFAIIFFIVVGILLAFTNLRELKRHLFNLRILPFIAGGACTLLTYVCEGLFLFFSLRLFKERLGLVEAFRYSFIINGVGYLVSFGGLTPFATQVHVLDYAGVSPKKATLSRALHVVIFNIFFNILLIYGYTSVLVNKKAHELQVNLLTVIVMFFVFLLILFYVAIFYERIRVSGLWGIARFFTIIVRPFGLKRDLKPDNAINFFREFQEGCKSLIQNPLLFIILLGVALADWVFMLGIMHFSFLSLTYNIRAGFLIIGFTIGQIIVVVSMVPGGAGTMEGSMAMTYRALGTPLEISLAAVLIFRTLFYILPFFLCLPFYFTMRSRMRNRWKF